MCFFREANLLNLSVDVEQRAQVERELEVNLVYRTMRNTRYKLKKLSTIEKVKHY